MAFTLRKKRHRLAWALAAFAVLPTSPAWAQVAPPTVPPGVADPAAPLRIERQQIDRLRDEQRLQQQPTRPDVTLPATPAPPQPSQVRNIPVKGFEVSPSAVLSAEEIKSALQPFENRTLSLADLFEAVAALNKLYDAKNMPTARAYLPQQDIANGIVKINLVEARIGQIQVGPTTHVSSDFVQKRMSQKPGDLLSAAKLEQDLIRFNRLHDVQLRAGVQAGTSPSTTDVKLEPVEPGRLQFSAFADNAGGLTTGEERVGATVRMAGYSGNGDSATLSLVNGRGSSSFSLGYALPLTADDLRLDVSYSTGRIKVINGAFVPLDIGGLSRELSIGLTQPLVVDANRLWNLYGRLARKTSISDFGGVSQTPNETAVLTVGFSGEVQSDTTAWTLDAGVKQGLREFEGKSEFTALRANASWLKRLGSQSQIVLRGGFQYTETQVLPSGEQFLVGGSSTVRGFSEGTLSGRNGYLASAEWRYLFQDPAREAQAPSDLRFTGIAFIDHGAAFPFRPSPLLDATGNDYLTGAGFGINVDFKRSTSARLTLAWPLRDNPSDAQPRRPQLNFSLNYTWP